MHKSSVFQYFIYFFLKDQRHNFVKNLYLLVTTARKLILLFSSHADNICTNFYAYQKNLLLKVTGSIMILQLMFQVSLMIKSEFSSNSIILSLNVKSSAVELIEMTFDGMKMLVIEESANTK